jgi:hypothetical protein
MDWVGSTNGGARGAAVGHLGARHQACGEWG